LCPEENKSILIIEVVPILFVITQFWVPQKLLFFFYIKIKIKDKKRLKNKKNTGRRATWLVRTG
jgi:hypothetical protein